MIRVVHPGYGYRIRILTFYLFRIQGPKRHRIPDSDPQHWLQLTGDERQWSRRADSTRTWASPHHGQDVGGLAALHLGFKRANFLLLRDCILLLRDVFCYCVLYSVIAWICAKIFFRFSNSCSLKNSYRLELSVQYHIECGYVGLWKT